MYGPWDGLIASSAVSGAAAVQREGWGRTDYEGAGLGTALAGVGGPECAEPVGVGFDEVGDAMEQPARRRRVASLVARAAAVASSAPARGRRARPGVPVDASG
ncbi:MULTISPECIES: hypothetical protein [unclassified Streptomyces]|uniref:hypothetical protein n=1 Tax=unclassified Streptomyces TaxID=2593676 RepID=UPI00382AA2B3